jgi:hypothetical protein
MASVRIVDASPPILLGKIRRLELLFVGEPEVVVPLILRAKAEGVLEGSERVGDRLDALEREGMYPGTDLRAEILDAAHEQLRTTVRSSPR